MSLQQNITNTNPTGYTYFAIDEVIVITEFSDVEATAARGGYTKWPSYFSTRTHNWDSWDTAEKIRRLNSRSYPVWDSESTNSKEAWISGMIVGGG
jgi:hypothetical protein